jgi:hypothetical protein
MILSKQLSLTTLSVLLLTPLAHAGVTEDIENALKFGQADAKYGQIKVDLRYRYEHYDTGNPALKPGNVSEARLQLGYLTPEFKGFQGYVEYAGNQDIGVNDYNSTRNGKTQFEVIPDPQQHVLNQLWISYKGIPDTEVKIGRQRINFDNQRFVGSVGWRMMEQMFDAILVTNTSLPNTTIRVGYINKAQNINAMMKGMEFPFANISYNFADIGTLTSYAYLMDFNEPVGSLGGLTHLDSNQTYGVRFDGTRKINDDFKAHYTAEYAYQRDYKQSPTPYSANYYHLIGGFSAFGVTAKAGFEQLDGKGVGKTFDTPLATLHIFNGWADQFLTTPANGLRDVYGSLSTEVEGVKLTGMYHEFTDDTGKMDYGKEWDFLVTKEFLKHYTILAKYSYYDAAATSGKFDAQRFWLGAGVSF